jgi:hypothetical protein
MIDPPVWPPGPDKRKRILEALPPARDLELAWSIIDVAVREFIDPVSRARDLAFAKALRDLESVGPAIRAIREVLFRSPEYHDHAAMVAALDTLEAGLAARKGRAQEHDQPAREDRLFVQLARAYTGMSMEIPEPARGFWPFMDLVLEFVFTDAERGLEGGHGVIDRARFLRKEKARRAVLTSTGMVFAGTSTLTVDAVIISPPPDPDRSSD